MEVRNYAHIAKTYCEDVVAGRVSACRWVQLACERHLSDLKRQADAKFAYQFDEEKAGRACTFIELLPHTKGQWASRRELLTLEPWQVFILASVFGWTRKESGLRRFRTAYIEVPRKNGKSALSAGIGLYMMLADGEFGAEVYSGATTEKQAFEVFRPAWEMVHASPDLQDYFGVELGGTKKNPGPIYCLKTSSRFETLIGKPGDGASPSCAIIDEYHEHQSDAQFDTMQTGMGAREQGLMWVITTAGDNIAGPCYALRQEVVRMLEGTVPADHLFGVIYTIDEGDDWKSEEALKKANPNFGVSVIPSTLMERAAEATNSSRKQGVFKTKHANVWLTARDGWMNMEAWNAAADPTLREEDFHGEPCWIGLDLSSKLDITSAVKLFKREIDGETHFYLFGRHYVPEVRVEDPDARHYQGWVTDGSLRVTEGDVIDYDVIREDLRDDSERFRIVHVGYDPYGAAQLAIGIERDGISTLEIPQNTRHLSEPMKWIEALTLAGRFHHDGNPAMNWMVSNVVVREDANENIFPRKERRENKIDGLVAAVIAMNVAMREETPASVYETRGIRVL